MTNPLSPVWDKIPTVYKAISIIAVIAGIGVAAGGATVSFTEVPQRLDALEKIHREDMEELRDATSNNRDANEESNQKLDRVICMLERQAEGRNPLGCELPPVDSNRR